MAATTVSCLGEGMVVFIPDDAARQSDQPHFVAGVGGAELNVATALVALGTPAAWLSRVGDDAFGRQLLAHASSRGIDITGVEVDAKHQTGIYIKELTRAETGRATSRMRYYRAGSAASHLSPEYARSEPVRRVLSSSGILHVSGITAALSASARRLALGIHRQFDGLVSVDANWRPLLWAGRERYGIRTTRALMRSADIVFIGADEAQALLGTSDPGAIRRALPEPHRLVVKMDAHGAVGFEGTQRVDVPTTPIEVVEPIGAGDAFAAGVLSALAADGSLSEAILLGHQTAVRALRSSGDHL